MKNLRSHINRVVCCHELEIFKVNIAERSRSIVPFHRRKKDSLKKFLVPVATIVILREWIQLQLLYKIVFYVALLSTPSLNHVIDSSRFSRVCAYVCDFWMNDLEERFVSIVKFIAAIIFAGKLYRILYSSELNIVSESSLVKVSSLVVIWLRKCGTIAPSYPNSSSETSSVY